MGQNDFILDGMRWSFSSVNTYHTCPQAFRLGYLDALSREDNAFSDWGSFLHAILERYFKGELEFFELSQVYEGGYQEHVTHPFPPNAFCDLAERYYQAGKDYLDRFDGLFPGCTVLGVEQKVFLKLEGRPFVGVIDLLLETPEHEIWIVDHKSKSKFKTQQEQAEYARQLYLYAYHVYERYQHWPKKLIFHMIRSGGALIEIPFHQPDAEAARAWFLSTIDAIYADSVFESEPNRCRRELRELRHRLDEQQIPFDVYRKQKKALESKLKNQSFMCWQLCGSRMHCPDRDKAPREN